MPKEVTFAQARAFVEALTGWEEVGVNGDGETAARPKSPHARTHLEAILGLRGVPTASAVSLARGRDESSCRAAAEVREFIEYLEAVAAALRAGCGIEA